MNREWNAAIEAAAKCAESSKGYPTPVSQKILALRKPTPARAYLRLRDAGTDNACWVVCAKGDPGAIPFEAWVP